MDNFHCLLQAGKELNTVKTGVLWVIPETSVFTVFKALQKYYLPVTAVLPNFMLIAIHCPLFSFLLSWKNCKESKQLTRIFLLSFLKNKKKANEICFVINL